MYLNIKIVEYTVEYCTIYSTMYLVYVGKECIFRCTFFKSHLHAFLYPQVHVYILASLDPHILRFMCTCMYIPIFTSSGSCVLVDIHISLHPHILRFMFACWCPGILTSLYPHVHLYLLASLHPYIVIYSSSCVLACILTS